MDKLRKVLNGQEDGGEAGLVTSVSRGFVDDTGVLILCFFSATGCLML